MILLTLLFLATDASRSIAGCTVGIGLGIYAFYRGFRLLQRRQLILDTPVSKIRSASMGMVEVSGLAVGPYTVVAPVTSRVCYYHRTLVWELKQCGRSKQWVKVAAESMHVPFFLDDNTGKVMVDPRGAELDLHCDFHREFCDSFFTIRDEVPDNVRVLLSRHGVNTTNKIKVEEFCIKPKNALFILGTLGDNPDLELAPQPIHDEEYNTLTFGKSLWENWVAPNLLARSNNDDVPAEEELSVAQRLFGGLSKHRPSDCLPYDGPSAMHSPATENPELIRLSTNNGPTLVAEMTQQEKVAAALMKAGIRNPAAWAAAGADGAAGVDNPDHSSVAMGSNEGFETHPPVVLTKGANNPTFLISWRSQRELATSLGWKCALMIWGGPALALLCLYGLLAVAHTN